MDEHNHGAKMSKLSIPTKNQRFRRDLIEKFALYPEKYLTTRERKKYMQRAKIRPPIQKIRIDEKGKSSHPWTFCLTFHVTGSCMSSCKKYHGSIGEGEEDCLFKWCEEHFRWQGKEANVSRNRDNCIAVPSSGSAVTTNTKRRINKCYRRELFQNVEAQSERYLKFKEWERYIQENNIQLPIKDISHGCKMLSQQQQKWALCLSFHVRGFCYSTCHCGKYHGSLSSIEDGNLSNWCEKHFRRRERQEDHIRKIDCISSHSSRAGVTCTATKNDVELKHSQEACVETEASLKSLERGEAGKTSTTACATDKCPGKIHFTVVYFTERSMSMTASRPFFILLLSSMN